MAGETLDPKFSVAAHDRSYYVWVPNDYQPATPYRVTFLFVGCGDRNAAATANYKMFSGDKQSIYVAMNMPPAGFPPMAKDCFDNTVGNQSIEWEFMGSVASQVQKNFCVDENRVFVAGYSSGAWVSNMSLASMAWPAPRSSRSCSTNRRPCRVNCRPTALRSTGRQSSWGCNITYPSLTVESGFPAFIRSRSRTTSSL